MNCQEKDSRNTREDKILIPNAPGSTLDPASYPRGLVTRMIIDASKPLPPDISLQDLSLVSPPEEGNQWIEQLNLRMKWGK